MAFNASAVLKPTRADFYWAEVGTPKPSDYTKTPEGAWENVGHSSIEDILTVSTEGGEATQLGSIQAPSLRTSVSSAIRSFTVNFLQWDTATMKLYYGSNAKVGVDGALQIPEQPIPSEGAWLAVIRDGSNYGGFYAQKCSAIGDGDFSISDTDSLAQLPVKFTPTSVDGSEFAFEFLPMKAAAGAAVEPGGDAEG